MKRASTKKVNAVPTCPVRQDASEGHLSPVPLEVNRRVRTSAAMIGLAISMGASSILLTRQSDRALATEPVVSKPTVTTVPVAQEDPAYAVAPINQVVPEVISSGNAVTSSSVVVPIIQGMPTGAVVVKPMMPGLNQPVQAGPTLWQLSQYQVDAGEVNAYSNPADQSDLQAEQALQVPVANRAIQEATVGRTAEISRPYAVPNEIAQPTSATTAGEINALLKAKQAIALNQLKHKSNRLQNSLAEWRSEESSGNEATVTQGAVFASKSEEAQITASNKDVTRENVDKATKELALKVDAPNTALNLPQRFEELPSAVAEPTAVVPATIAPAYQVRKGDTLSTIAHNYGITLAELVSVNHLTNPNRLQVNQRLRIPVSEPSLLADNQTVAESNWHSSQTVLNTATGRRKQAGKNLAAKNLAVPVLAAPLAETPSTYVSIPAIDQIHQSEKSAKPELQSNPSNPYVENLRLEVLRLRERYQAQQTDHQVLPVAAQPSAVSVPISVPAPSTALRSSQPNTLEFQVNQQKGEPNNPDFLPEQLPLASSTTRKGSLTKGNEYPATSPQMATAPIGVNAFDSLQSLRGRQVSPELPPLAAVDRYLPKPFDASTPFKAGFIWPAKGLLTSGFGWRWGRMHKGIDIAAPIGTPVVAAAAGVVVSAGWNSGGYGNLVDIQHSDGSLTRYAHNNRILVQVGQQVEQGEQISEMGSTGYSTGPHCHFEVHPSGHGAVNPIAFLPSHSS